MDYSKLRKILIILCIISVILNISKKVFAVDLNTDNTYTVKSYNQDITLPEAFKNNYWFCYISNNTPGFNGFMARIFYSNKRFNANLVSGSYIISSLNDAKIVTYQTSGPSRSLSNIQSYVNGLSFDLTNVSANNYTNLNLLPSSYNKGGVLASNFTITNDNGEIVINKTNENTINPYFATTNAEFENLSFDNVIIETGTYDTNNPLYFKILEVTNKIEDTENPANNIYYFNDLTFTLDNKSKYYKQLLDTSIYYFSVPKSALKLKKDTSYYFMLTNDPSQYSNYQGELTTNENIFSLVLVDSADLITTQDEILNSINNNNPSDNTNNIISNNLPNPDIPDDITANTFNWIYNYINNTLHTIIEGTPSIYLEFPSFFTNNSNLFHINISGNELRSRFPENSIVINFLESFYWFIISLYIINDIRKYIEKIKTGDIMTHTDTNIKSEML